jgi:hypothetical protein
VTGTKFFYRLTGVSDATAQIGISTICVWGFAKGVEFFWKAANPENLSRATTDLEQEMYASRAGFTDVKKAMLYITLDKGNWKKRGLVGVVGIPAVVVLWLAGRAVFGGQALENGDGAKLPQVLLPAGKKNPAGPV